MSGEMSPMIIELKTLIKPIYLGLQSSMDDVVTASGILVMLYLYFMWRLFK
jgi:hypothetical protein